MTRLPFILPGLLLCLVTPVFAQQKIDVFGYTYHSINDTLYAGEREISNLEYRNFLASISPAESAIYLYDSTLWQTAIGGVSYNEPFTRHYHWHPAFDTYPVVNIAHAHAMQYCEWLTGLYNFKKKKSALTFRLPTLEEWKLLADPDPRTNLPFGIGNGQNKKGCYIINVNPDGEFVSDGAHYTAGAPRYSNYLERTIKPTTLGLYHVIGNVAEMTTEDGIQKGGSWFDDPEECYTYNVQHYPTPDPRVGFRVVAIKGEKEERQKR